MEVRNESGRALTSLVFKETDLNGDESVSETLPDMPPGAVFTHRIRGDAQIALSYFIGDEHFKYARFTTAGWRETWFVAIQADGTTLDGFKTRFTTKPSIVE